MFGFLGNRKLGWGVRKLFFEQASSQLENGLAITLIIDNFVSRLRRRGKHKDADIFVMIGNGVRNGSTLTSIMSSHLTDVEVGLLSAGEKSGSVSQAMKYIVETKERERRIVGKLRSSMINPLVYMVVGFSVLFFIGKSVVPQFATVVPPSKWTGFAAVMRDMGEFATGMGLPIVVFLLVCLIVAIWMSMPKWVGGYRDIFDRSVFPWTVYKEMQGFSWLTAFISMLRSGVADVNAIESQIKTANPWLADILTTVRRSMVNGDNLFVSLRSTGTDFPSQDLVEEIGAYVAFPDFPEKLSAILSSHVEQFEARIAKIGTVVSIFFTVEMFSMFLIIQLGANDLASISASAVNF